MGKVKHIQAELDFGWDVRLMISGATIMLSDDSIELTVNDLEQMIAVIKYLRNVAPFETADPRKTLEFRAVENE